MKRGETHRHVRRRMCELRARVGVGVHRNCVKCNRNLNQYRPHDHTCQMPRQVCRACDCAMMSAPASQPPRRGAAARHPTRTASMVHTVRPRRGQGARTRSARGRPVRGGTQITRDNPAQHTHTHTHNHNHGTLEKVRNPKEIVLKVPNGARAAARIHANACDVGRRPVPSSLWSVTPCSPPRATGRTGQGSARGARGRR